MMYRVYAPGAVQSHEDENFIYRDGLAFPKWANGSGECRTPRESPYAHGTYVLHGDPVVFRGEGISINWSDRLRSQISEAKWDAANRFRTSNRYADETLESLSAFLSALFGRPVECLQVLASCNVSSGNPLWVFITRDLEKE